MFGDKAVRKVKEIHKFIIMTIVKLGKKNRTVKVVGAKTLPCERKEPEGDRFRSENLIACFTAQGKKVGILGNNICPYCGAHLDPGEKCDCREDDKAIITVGTSLEVESDRG